MKIVLLAPSSSIHTQKWAKFLSESGHKVSIITLDQDELKDVKTYRLNYPRLPLKLGYLFTVGQIKSMLREINPDVMHAHYLSSYGLLARLSDFHPFVVSVWGSDIFNFPKISPIHKKIISDNLKKADFITTTSNFMKVEIEKYLKEKEIKVIPFGVDTDLFKPGEVRPNNLFVIGTARSLREKYGLVYLIKAFERFVEKIPNSELQIAGKGLLERKLKDLSESLGLAGKVKFLGFLSQKELAMKMRSWDVVVVPSIEESESFGVIALEASASGKPVVASLIGGLRETVIDGETGIMFEPKNDKDLYEKLLLLYKDESIRSRLGRDGRVFVEDKYDWKKTAPAMLEVYKKIVQ